MVTYPSSNLPPEGLHQVSKPDIWPRDASFYRSFGPLLDLPTALAISLLVLFAGGGLTLGSWYLGLPSGTTDFPLVDLLLVFFIAVAIPLVGHSMRNTIRVEPNLVSIHAGSAGELNLAGDDDITRGYLKLVKSGILVVIRGDEFSAISLSELDISREECIAMLSAIMESFPIFVEPGTDEVATDKYSIPIMTLR